MPTKAKAAKTKPSTSAARTTSAARSTTAGKVKPVVHKRATKTATATNSRAGVPKARTPSQVQAKPGTAIKSVTPKTKVSKVIKKTNSAKNVLPVTAPEVANNKKAGPGKPKKTKLVRDSFTMPDSEYALIATLKKRCLTAGMAVKKSEVLRAAIANLAKLSDAALIAAMQRLEIIKTGRPAKARK